ncbi:MAG: Sec-independent protein translocase, TatC subunit [Thermoleophilia bacterium]|nr:Sec-independent protein translocase, TatC subunit [Thermoleophilia bacterium]
MTVGAPPSPPGRRSSARALARLRRSSAPDRGSARPRERADVATVVEHLSELRTRVFIVMGWLVAAFAACYWRRDELFSILDRPLDDRWPLQTLGVTEPFFTSLSVAAQAALVLTTPVIAWNAWRFVRPAVAPEARRTIRALLIAAPLLFTAGVAFAYFLILAPAVQFLLGIGPDSIDVVVRANDYYHFVTTTLLAVGAAFCFPLVLLGLARVGILTADRLRSSRRIAYVLMVVLAALLPTADPVSLAIEILPLVALYELSILGVRMQERIVERAAAAAEADAAAATTEPTGAAS